MFTIHPGFLTYLERASRGDRVIWQENMRLLHCFSRTWCGDHSQLTFSRYTGMYELGYERDAHGEFDYEKPDAIVFYCAHAQLLKRHHVLGELRDDFSLPALILLEDAINILNENGDADPELELTHERARRFVTRENILIPWSELQRIFGTLHGH